MDAGALRRDVAAARATLAGLQVLLDEERLLIERRQATELRELAERKTRALAELQQNNPATRAGIGMADLQTRIDTLADASLSAQWQAFAADLRELRQANERNGLAIRRGLETVNSELDILRGGSAGGDDGLYDAGGQRDHTGAGHLFTRA